IDPSVSISTLKTTKIDMVAAVVYNVPLIGVGGYHSGLGLTWTEDRAELDVIRPTVVDLQCFQSEPCA
ncbi:MAG: hypothetical protein QOH96_1108, partial [Blastocatellia bacterium]|nr:hypothetical protein [Blastocatellia bacterium]